MAPPLAKILFVEDELRLQKITCMALQRIGRFEVESCATGPETLALARRFQPDLILLDVHIPELDGPATLAALREMPEFAETPVIFMTANVSEEDIEAYKALGALEVITKPYDPAALSKRLNKLWNAHHSADEEEYQRHFQAARRSFRAELDGWIESLKLAAERLRRTDGEPGTALETLRETAHKIAGSAGSFGFPETSNAAEPLEKLAMQLIGEAGMPSSEILNQIAAHIGEIENAAGRDG
ncbi:MAG: response regulator [Rhodospirillales bacterium]|jgi:CheY-like chemotaxis protein|nr:response regulator [Rhodospirillales bacterium]MDP6644986.1 response regulator [Rhodospirillales bacterium]MDP6840648.1 response regulator [Rhodospirillales bacterium]